MLGSILVLFFRRRLMPSMPMPGDPRAPGLDMDWSDVRFSAQTASTQRKERKVKARLHQDSQDAQLRTRGRARGGRRGRWGGHRDKPASLSHFSSSGFSLHMFLKLRFKASKRDIVVWLKSFPYSFPMARPTSPCRESERKNV